VDKRGRTGEKGAAWHHPGGDTQVKLIKVSPVFQEKINRGDTAELTTDRQTDGED